VKENFSPSIITVSCVQNSGINLKRKEVKGMIYCSHKPKKNNDKWLFISSPFSAGSKKKLKISHRIVQIVIFLIVILNYTSISIAMGDYITKKSSAFKILSQNKTLSWPESIDIDQAGNIYFTDSRTGELYRITRNSDHTLKSGVDTLITGLQSASGISICQEENMLYIGFVVNSNNSAKCKIARIPLDLFVNCEDCRYSYERLKAYAQSQKIDLTETDISEEPNGVVYYKEHQAVYFTHMDLSLPAWLFHKKDGYIGKIQPGKQEITKIITQIASPNGIDLDPSSDTPAVIVSNFFENSIMRIFLSTGKSEAVYPSSLDKIKDVLFGNWPDGLMCLSNGDILVASFMRGKIIYLSRNGNSYSDPVIIVEEGLNHPTDLTIALSSDGRGESLYVTTTKICIIPPFLIGKVIEIPNIKEKINNAKCQVKQVGF
jgi:sugar lactone lactonase YvrE